MNKIVQQFFLYGTMMIFATLKLLLPYDTHDHYLRKVDFAYQAYLIYLSFTETISEGIPPFIYFTDPSIHL